MRHLHSLTHIIIRSETNNLITQAFYNHHKYNMVVSFQPQPQRSTRLVINSLTELPRYYAKHSNDHWVTNTITSSRVSCNARPDTLHHGSMLSRPMPRAVKLSATGRNAVMPVIARESDMSYRWAIGHTPLESIVNIEHQGRFSGRK